MKPVNVPPAAQIVNDLSGDLFADGLDVETVLSVATRTLTRVRLGTWLAIVMCGDIVTSRVVVADDSDPKIAEYINRYIASVKKPGYAPTTGLSQQVIDSGEPILLPNVPAERFNDYMTPTARAWAPCRFSTPGSSWCPCAQTAESWAHLASSSGTRRTRCTRTTCSGCNQSPTELASASTMRRTGPRPLRGWKGSLLCTGSLLRSAPARTYG